MTPKETITAFDDLRNHIGRIKDEIETNGIKCNTGVYIALKDAWNKLAYTN